MGIPNLAHPVCLVSFYQFLSRQAKQMLELSLLPPVLITHLYSPSESLIDFSSKIYLKPLLGITTHAPASVQAQITS